jgi:hypothetical protein
LGQPRDVAAGPRQASDDPIPNRISFVRHDNGNRVRRFLGGTGYWRTGRNDNVYLETHQLGRERGEAIEFSLCISILNDNVFPLHVAELPQTLPERLGASHDRRSGGTKYASYAENFRWLLRVGQMERKQN